MLSGEGRLMRWTGEKGSSCGGRVERHLMTCLWLRRGEERGEDERKEDLRKGEEEK